MTERRWRDVRMPPDSLRAELYGKLRATQAASPGADPQAWIAPIDWWPEVVRVLGLPVVRRVGVTELAVSMDYRAHAIEQRADAELRTVWVVSYPAAGHRDVCAICATEQRADQWVRDNLASGKFADYNVDQWQLKR